MQKQGLRVFAEPAWRSRTENPYTYLLSKALTENGSTVIEMTRRTRLFGRADIVHIHWPQPGSQNSLRRAAFRSLEKLLGLTVQKLRGATIVWTVHNIRGHDQKNKRLEALVMAAVVRLVDGVIFLGESSREEAFQAMPVLSRKPCAIIPHGMYEQPSGGPQSSSQARSIYGLDERDRVIGFLGDIKPYKGLCTLLKAFSEMSPGRATLFIAGIFRAPEDYAREQRNSLKNLIEKGHRILFVEQRLDDEQFAAAIRACDLVVLPYREIVNSGLALFVLGLGGRMVTSDRPGFRSLETELGKYWVRTAPDNSLHHAIDEALNQTRTLNDDTRMAAFCGERSWSSIGRRTVDYYSRLRNRHRMHAKAAQ